MLDSKSSLDGFWLCIIRPCLIACEEFVFDAVLCKLNAEAAPGVENACPFSYFCRAEYLTVRDCSSLRKKVFSSSTIAAFVLSASTSLLRFFTSSDN